MGWKKKKKTKTKTKQSNIVIKNQAKNSSGTSAIRGQGREEEEEGGYDNILEQV